MGVVGKSILDCSIMFKISINISYVRSSNFSDVGISSVVAPKLMIHDRCSCLVRRSRSPKRQKVVLLLRVAVTGLIELVRLCRPENERSIVVILYKS
jgi:hypothetical protein